MGIKEILQEGVSYITDLENKNLTNENYIGILEHDIAALRAELDASVKPLEVWEVKANTVIAAGNVLDALGVPYVFGGETIKGMDCSGFTQFLFGLVGVPLPRTSANQAKSGTDVDKVDQSKWRKGDLCFFDYSKDGVIDHVGIYIGNGQMLHTNTPLTGINVKAVGTPTVVRRIIS